MTNQQFIQIEPIDTSDFRAYVNARGLYVEFFVSGERISLDVHGARRWAEWLQHALPRITVEPTRDLQPIATAPRDGTPILGYSDSDFFEGRKTRFVVVHYASEMQGWTMPGVGGLSVTHWAPLPQWVEYRGSAMSNLTPVNRPAEPT